MDTTNVNVNTNLNAEELIMFGIVLLLLAIMIWFHNPIAIKARKDKKQKAKEQERVARKQEKMLQEHKKMVQKQKTILQEKYLGTKWFLLLPVWKWNGDENGTEIIPLDNLRDYLGGIVEEETFDIKGASFQIGKYVDEKFYPIKVAEKVSEHVFPELLPIRIKVLDYDGQNTCIQAEILEDEEFLFRVNYVFDAEIYLSHQILRDLKLPRLPRYKKCFGKKEVKIRLKYYSNPVGHYMPLLVE
jgi:hypothetical protein